MVAEIKWKPRKSRGRAGKTPLPWREEYATGDTVFVRVFGRSGLERGTVLSAFGTNQHTNLFYIIQLTDSSYPHLVIRDALLIGEWPDAPLPIETLAPEDAVARWPKEYRMNEAMLLNKGNN